GASINATRATSAAIWSRQISLQFERSQDDAEEQPRSDLLIQDACVLADPPNARIFRIYAFHKRTCVYIVAGLKFVGRVWVFIRRFAFGIHQPRVVAIFL